MTRRRRVMKFVLGLVALVLVGLSLYVYTGKDHKQPQKQTVHKTVKEVTPSQEEVASVEKKVTEKVEPVVQHTVGKESLKVQSTSSEVQNTSSSDETFYADDSMSEEERRIDKAIRSQSENIEFEVSSEEEILETIQKDYGQSN